MNRYPYIIPCIQTNAYIHAHAHTHTHTNTRIQSVSSPTIEQIKLFLKYK